MYKIKGQDQKEYGPVDAAQVRQWLLQGRVDARTLAQLAGTADWQPLGSFPEFAATAAPPPLISSAPPPPVDNSLAALIPYKNGAALTAYYLGVFSLIPCFGLFLGTAAFIMGIIGLKRAKQSPEAKGKVHAWIGVILGGLVVLAHIALIICLIAARHPNRGVRL